MTTPSPQKTNSKLRDTFKNSEDLDVSIATAQTMLKVGTTAQDLGSIERRLSAAFNDSKLTAMQQNAIAEILAQTRKPLKELEKIKDRQHIAVSLLREPGMGDYAREELSQTLADEAAVEKKYGLIAATEEDEPLVRRTNPAPPVKVFF